MVEKGDMARSEQDFADEPSQKDPLQNGDDENELPSFSDPEDFVDAITEEELLGDILQHRPAEADGVESVIVVDNIPQVGSERLEKLKNVMMKIYSQFGEINTEFIPVDETGKTKGYMFLEYKNPQSALDAVKVTNGHKLDKQHSFAVNLFTDFQKYENIPEEWKEPQPQPYVDHGNLRQWLQDPDCFDQFCVMYCGGEKVAVYLNSNPEPTVVKDRERWTDNLVMWSPLGTYLATFHQQGIALWGGPQYNQIMRFTHFGVKFIDFSPCENYLVTLSPPSPDTFHQPQRGGAGGPGGPEEAQVVIIWDIRTGMKRRSFTADPEMHTWPMFKWSSDDRFFARLTQDMLSIYETPSFGLLDKKSLKIPGIRNFSWSPVSNILAYWVAEDKNVPARVTLIEVPSRVELRAKNLFNVAECKMHWQKSGDYLCVKVDRYTKAKKEKNEWKYSGMYFNFEIFLMKEKQIPVDSLEIKDTIVAFAWEPVGSKFAIIHGESPHISVSFYGVKPGASAVLLKKFERKQCNHIFWSPAGQFIVLAGLRTMSGSLEFVDTSDFTVMNQNDHFMASDVEWDPTGRYVVTGVSWWLHKTDNAYWLWSFQGRVLRKCNMDRFCQLLWRPRPPSLITEEKLREIRKNFKKYSEQFDLRDRASMTKASKEVMEKRKKMLEDFRALQERKAKEYMNMRELRMELRDGIDTDELDSNLEDLEEEVVEFLIKEEEIVAEGDADEE
uniref:Eukaryotic translation initiation factor 3 subunit B n=1 Tax=Ixodes ricinus TaxID=34613 RepID=A0A131XUJ2_IXORI